MKKIFFPLFLFTFIAPSIVFSQSTASTITAYGYHNCILLKNKNTSVILDPNVGGRLLAYELNGKNILFENRSLDGKIWEVNQPKFRVVGGRFDIGPEQTTPFRASFYNTWTGKIIDQQTARMTSAIDTTLGIQLIREFKLSPSSSHLTVTQHIINISDTVHHYAHWSRTYAKGGGICLVPLNPNSRLPKGYAIYRKKYLIDYKPAQEDHLRVREGILEMIGVPTNPKFVMDSNAGWLAYLSEDNLLFVKKFEANENRPYGDMLSNQVSIYFKEDSVELEPIGPIEKILPQQSVSFTEEWWLLPYSFPMNRTADLDAINRIVKGL